VPKKIIAVRVKKQEIRELKKIAREAKDEDITVSSMVRVAIREFLNRRKRRRK
jgi:hypothetical protein